MTITTTVTTTITTTTSTTTIMTTPATKSHSLGMVDNTHVSLHEKFLTYNLVLKCYIISITKLGSLSSF